MAVWDIEKVYFDGKGGVYYFDDPSDVYFDQEGDFNNILTIECDAPTQQYISNEFSDCLIEVGTDVDADYSKYLELIQLVPEKFRGSVLLNEYLDEVGLFVGSWLSKIDNMLELSNPNTVGDKYIGYLADMINFSLTRGETTSLTELRRQLNQAVDWYKIKGTYQSFKIAAYICGYGLNIYDMYTKDYVNFIPKPWFTATEAGENPEGLDSSYYKSPHIGLEIPLNIVHGTKLWEVNFLEPFDKYVEEVRPANTVPHYSILLNPETDESEDVRVNPGNIKTRVMVDWNFTRLYFNALSDSRVIDHLSQLVHDNANEQVRSYYTQIINFDNSFIFDYSEDAFIANITKWKLGNGNKGRSPDELGIVDLENVVLSGDIETIEIHKEYLDFKFTVPKATVQDGISELGLYLTNNTTITVMALFPDIDKGNDVDLHVTVRVLRVAA
jgi:hypothetical protein